MSEAMIGKMYKLVTALMDMKDAGKRLMSHVQVLLSDATPLYAWLTVLCILHL